MNFDTCCRIFLSIPQKIADVYLSMTSNASCEQLEEGEKKIPKAVSHSILYNKVTMKTIWQTFYKNYLIKQIDSMLPCVCQKDIKIWRHTRLLFSRTKLEREKVSLKINENYLDIPSVSTTERISNLKRRMQ